MSSAPPTTVFTQIDVYENLQVENLMRQASAGTSWNGTEDILSWTGAHAVGARLEDTSDSGVLGERILKLEMGCLGKTAECTTIVLVKDKVLGGLKPVSKRM